MEAMGALHWFLRFREGVGIRLVAFGIACFVASVLPLLIYVVLGPADGNPIGLGLLMMLGVLVLVVAGGLGLVVMVVEARSLTRGR